MYKTISSVKFVCNSFGWKVTLVWWIDQAAVLQKQTNKHIKRTQSNTNVGGINHELIYKATVV